MPVRPARTVAAVAALALAGVLTACSSDADQSVDVAIGDGTCELSSTTLDAGTTEFDVKNDSGEEAEAYVYNADGDKVDEVEGIADGTSRTLTVKLDAGSYEFACKPEGDDNRTDFTVQ
jgi:iron uptake system component EfeO